MLQYLLLLRDLLKNERFRRVFLGIVRIVGFGALILLIFLIPRAVNNGTDAMDRDFAREQLGLVCVSPDEVKPGVEPVDLDAAFNDLYREFFGAVGRSVMNFWRSDGDKLDEILQRLDAIEQRIDSHDH